MSKIWLVARNEYRTHVQKRSFLLGLFSVPLIAVVVFGVALLMNPPRSEQLPTIGYVDRSGRLILPFSAEDETRWGVRLVPLADETAASSALVQGQVLAYYVLPAGYPTDNQVSLYASTDISADAVAAFQSLLRINLLTGQPPEIARRVVVGSDQVIRLTDGREIGGEFNVGYIVPVLAGAALLVLIFFGSDYLMQALTEERVNRTVEILATSVSPGQLMTGKIGGIIAVVFTQLAAWAAFGVAAVAVGRSYLALEWLQDMQVDPSALALVAALVLPAFLLIASLMTIIGVLLDDPRAGQQVMGGIISFSILPMGFIGVVLADMNGGLAVALSILPFTAPIFLPLRMALAVVPAWQVAASVGTLYLVALGALGLAGQAVRLGMLRYGRAVRWGELWGRPSRPARPAPTAWEARRAARPRREAEEPAAALVKGSRRSKTWLIMRQELVHVITRPWFALLIVGLPLLIFGQMFLLYRQGNPAGSSVSVEADTTLALAVTPQVLGYVDQARLIQAIPEQVPPGTLIGYPDEASAQRAMEDGTIASYVVIPPGYVQTGQLVVVRRDISLTMQRDYRWIEWLLLTNLLGGDTRLAAQVWAPLDTQVMGSMPSTAAASATEERAEDEARLTSLLVTLLFYAVILMSAGFLMRSVSEEKKNRTAEVLLLSASPEQILTGKTIALGLVGLLQGVGWVVITYLLFSLGGMTFRLPGSIDLPPEFLIGAAVLFLLGYAVYASLYAGAGAMVPDWRQAKGASLLIILPAFVGFEIGIVSEDPHSLLMVITSIFPLTAPMVMIKRLLSGGVPLWQLLLSGALMAASAYWITRAVARMFHAQNLLSGQPFSARRYFRALLGRGTN